MKILVSFAVAASVLAASVAHAELGRVTVGTNPQGTTYFVVGGGFAKKFSDELGINATAQPYAGSSVYLPLINSGEVTMGLSSSLDSGLAYQGKESYEEIGSLSNLRTLIRTWPLPYTYFVRADSGIKSIADLEGKKVAVTIGANTSLKLANEAMLRAGGLDPDADVEAVSVSGLPEGYNLVTEGRIAAATTALGIPLARQAHASIPGGLQMLAITGDNATTEFVAGEMEGLYLTETAPSENNPGVDAPMSVLGFDIFLVGSSALSDDDAYQITKTLHEGWVALQEDYGVLRRTPVEMISAPTNTTPYHPGAIRYFKEVDLWSADNDAREATLNK